MTPLDPARYSFAVLVDPTHRLPLTNGRFFDPKGQLVDRNDALIGLLLADGSIRLGPSPDTIEAAAEKPSPTPEPSAPSGDAGA